MHSRVKSGWAASSAAFAGTKRFWERSALVMLLYEVVSDALRKHANGDLLDAGAGTLTYKPVAAPYVDSYTGIDFKETHLELDRVGDIQAMPFFNDTTFDTVLCVEVLEHVPYPAKALAEFYRVLRPGGKVIITVPHIGYLHNEPHDYYRFTHYGLRQLLEDAGFNVISIEPNGGFISFLQHIPATILIGATHGIPIIGPVVHEINYWLGRLALVFDKYFDRKRLFAIHYAAIAEKSK